jgi:hypothetical protein
MPLSTHVITVPTDDLRLAKTIHARWTLRAAAGDFQPEVANDLVTWTERESGRFLIGKNYVHELELLQLNPDNMFTPQTTLDEDTFADAKISVAIMIPRLLAALAKKFRDKFYMRATQQRFKLYYYFSGEPALETFALTLTLKRGKPFLWLGYIPNKLTGGADFSKAIQEQVAVSDPEMAGLAMMRLVRSLLAKVK